jgi:hypothetical protein
MELLFELAEQQPVILLGNSNICLTRHIMDKEFGWCLRALIHLHTTDTYAQLCKNIRNENRVFISH